MGKYDFTTVLDRHGKDSLAVDKIPLEGAEVEEGFTKIPMWIADMSFKTAPSVIEAIRSRLEMPNFGYFAESDDWYDSIIRWHRDRKGDDSLTRESIGYENGVLGGLASALTAFTVPGDKILMHSPCYCGFIETLRDLGRPIVYSPLVRDADGVWRMDYEDMDRRLKAERIHFTVFCSPHNPCGRVWERWEIEKAMEVYAANDCIVLSDEIWSDIVMPGHVHIPTQTVSKDARQRTVALYAPSKTFSIAGLVGSYHVIHNPYLRDRLVRASVSTHYNECNVLSMHALIGAYSPEGSAWTDEMIAVIDRNLTYAYDFISRNWPEIRVMRPQGTYMLYLDLAPWLAAHHASLPDILRRGIAKGVIWQDGRRFAMDDTIRLNLALPFALEQEAFDRLKKYVFVD